ncbi:MAG: CPBP family intramembrane glutamic endopeptidase [Candidatus Micrarchaeia archaeon]
MKKENSSCFIYEHKRQLLSFLVSCIVVLASAAFAWFSKYNIFIFSIPLAIAAVWMLRRQACVLFLLFFAMLFSVLMAYVPYFTPILLSFLMLVFPIYVLVRSGQRDIVHEIGLGGGIIRALVLSFAFLIPAVILVFLLSYASSYFGVDDSATVAEKITSLPSYILFYALTLGPIAEEVFFRSFLPRYIHPILANLVFALAHVTYGSYIEILGAFVLGIYLYITFKLSKDLKVAIFLHTIINAVSIYVMVS